MTSLATAKEKPKHRRPYSLTYLKHQSLVIVVGAVVSVGCSALFSWIFTQSARALQSPTPLPSGYFINLHGNSPVIRPNDVIKFEVAHLPPGWSVFLAVVVGANHLYPESKGTLQPGSNDVYAASRITIGVPRATLYIVATDQLGTEAFSGYIAEQNALGAKGWYQSILGGWNSSPHVRYVEQHRVRSPSMTAKSSI